MNRTLALSSCLRMTFPEDRYSFPDHALAQEKHAAKILSTVSRGAGCLAYADCAAVCRGFIRVTMINASAMTATETYPVPCSKSRANRMPPVVSGAMSLVAPDTSRVGSPGAPGSSSLKHRRFF